MVTETETEKAIIILAYLTSSCPWKLAFKVKKLFAKLNIF